MVRRWRWEIFFPKVDRLGCKFGHQPNEPRREIRWPRVSGHMAIRSYGVCLASDGLNSIINPSLYTSYLSRSGGTSRGEAFSTARRADKSKEGFPDFVSHSVWVTSPPSLIC